MKKWVVLLTLLFLGQTGGLLAQQAKLSSGAYARITEIITFFDESDHEEHFEEIKTFVYGEKFIEEIYQHTKGLADSRRKAILNYYIGRYYYDVLGDNARAMRILNGKKLYQEFFTDRELTIYFMVMGDLTKISNNYINALYNFKEALSYAEADNYHYDVYSLNIEIGAIYKDLGEVILAEKYFLIAEDKLKVIDNLVSPFWLNLHLGDLYLKTNQVEKAFPYYKNVGSDQYIRGKSSIYCFGMRFMAQYNEKSNRLDSAMYYYDSIIDIMSDTALFQDRFILTEVYNDLGEFYCTESDTAQAMQAFWKSLNISMKLGVQKEIRRAAIGMNSLTSADDMKGKIEIQEILLNSYLNNEQDLLSSRNNAIKFDELRKKELEIDKVQQKTENRLIVIFLLLALFLTAIIGFFILRKRLRIIKENRLELRALIAKLNIVNRDLSVTNKKLDQFSSFVAHDIKESVIGIKFGIGILKEEQDKEEQLEMIESLNLEAEKLYEFIDELLKKAKNRNNSHRENNLNLAEIIESNISEAEFSIHTNNAEINFESTDIDFHGERLDFYRLFKNLLENSIKYQHPERNLVIDIEAKKTIDNTVFISFKDNGKGIPQEIKKKVFNLFEQGEGNTKIGFGLGLNICKEIISEYKNGEIWVDEDYIDGCLIHIKFEE